MSVTRPKGFVAAAGSAAIKGSGESDVTIVATDDARPVSAAGVFTKNKAAAAPVEISRRHLEETGGYAAGVILTSGNANAATGESGRFAARRLCGLVGDELGVSKSEVLICQTGLIGVRFPIETAERHVAAITRTRALGEEADLAAATAIMTTDTVVKTASAEGDGFIVGSIAKGAAMLAPDMATMLALVTTDANCSPQRSGAVLKEAVAGSFNEMTVDGCTSTNDTVILLASGKAERRDEVGEDELFDAVSAVCHSLALQMANDAEGATKVLNVTVTGASSNEEALIAARKVASSLLVKCSANGEDPYWGRVLSELGSAGVDFKIDRVSISYGGVAVCRGGEGVEHDRSKVGAHMAGRVIEIACDIGIGNGEGVVVGTDLGYGYIDENRTTS